MDLRDWVKLEKDLETAWMGYVSLGQITIEVF